MFGSEHLKPDSGCDKTKIDSFVVILQSCQYLLLLLGKRFDASSFYAYCSVSIVCDFIGLIFRGLSANCLSVNMMTCN